MEAAAVGSCASISRFGFAASPPPALPRFRHFPIKHSYSLSHTKSGLSGVISRRKGYMVVRASSYSSSSTSSDSAGSMASFAPLQLESPVGQFLSQILSSHPHLVPAAVEQQLEQLQSDRDADQHKEDPSASATDLVLYRRIAEVKANERTKALEEILYALVVQKFMDANVSLIPTIAPVAAEPSDQVDTWPSHDDKLERLHSPEAYEMIQNHLSLILGNRLGDNSSVAEISKLRVGQVYAASVMFGYFLKRVDKRFQLEKAMKILPNAADDGEIEQNMNPTGGLDESSHPEAFAGGISPGGFGHGMKASRLRTYVMSFDQETLQRYATIRSKEAVSIIEKHTGALFGRPENLVTPQGTIDFSKDEQIKISFGGLKTLVLEAVAFGSFLWDVESFVDSRYHFVLN
ncbi:hypothetical protein K2173_027121 [Erythroxylum novogranatense]|uniref:Uncharacterized protein n=1 Tax=Erythroxylum novogranatense TaxID=1862640 RepID=A0AAV8U1F5_9ROSI|nr:hypothetical protein K2173_027121 [Erythroxylum novogranatense]